MNETLINQLVKKLTIEDLDEKNSEIVEILGMDRYILLLKYYGGNRIYINRLSDILYPVKVKSIMEEFNGYNDIELSRKYDISTNRIRQIICTNKK